MKVHRTRFRKEEEEEVGKEEAKEDLEPRAQKTYHVHSIERENDKWAFSW